MRQIREFRSNFENIPRDCRATFVRVTHDFPTNVDYFHFIRTTFVRVSRKFRVVNSPKFRGDRFATLARQSRDSLAEYFGETIRIKFLNMFKTFATSSRHMKIHTTLARHSHECRAKVRDKFRKTVARNSHASEIPLPSYI